MLTLMPPKLRKELTTHRVGCCDPALLRTPVAWLLWPTLGLERGDELGCLLDLPGCPPWRVWYCTPDDVLALLEATGDCTKLLRKLERHKLFIDYRTTAHLSDDGWQVW